MQSTRVSAYPIEWNEKDAFFYFLSSSRYSGDSLL